MGRIRNAMDSVTDSQKRFGETMAAASQTMVTITAVAIAALLLAAIGLVATFMRD